MKSPTFQSIAAVRTLHGFRTLCYPWENKENRDKRPRQLSITRAAQVSERSVRTGFAAQRAANIHPSIKNTDRTDKSAKSRKILPTIQNCQVFQSNVVYVIPTKITITNYLRTSLETLETYPLLTFIIKLTFSYQPLQYFYRCVNLSIRNFFMDISSPSQKAEQIQKYIIMQDCAQATFYPVKNIFLMDVTETKTYV